MTRTLGPQLGRAAVQGCKAARAIPRAVAGKQAPEAPLAANVCKAGPPAAAAPRSGRFKVAQGPGLPGGWWWLRPSAPIWGGPPADFAAAPRRGGKSRSEG